MGRVKVPKHEHDWWPVRKADGSTYYECACGAVKLVSGGG